MWLYDDIDLERIHFRISSQMSTRLTDKVSRYGNPVIHLVIFIINTLKVYYIILLEWPIDATLYAIITFLSALGVQFAVLKTRMPAWAGVEILTGKHIGDELLCTFSGFKLCYPDLSLSSALVLPFPIVFILSTWITSIIGTKMKTHRHAELPTNNRCSESWAISQLFVPILYFSNGRSQLYYIPIDKQSTYCRHVYFYHRK